MLGAICDLAGHIVTPELDTHLTDEKIEAQREHTYTRVCVCVCVHTCTIATSGSIFIYVLINKTCLKIRG